MSATDDTLSALLEQSLRFWRIPARVSRLDDALTVSGLGRELRIVRASPGLPYRWLVTNNDRQRPAVSVIAVLRQVRLALDPGYAKMRLRVAGPPVVPPT